MRQRMYCACSEPQIVFLRKTLVSRPLQNGFALGERLRSRSTHPERPQVGALSGRRAHDALHAEGNGFGMKRLGDARQRHDRQVLPPAEMRDAEFDDHPGLTPDEGLLPVTSRAPRPSRPRLEALSTTRGNLCVGSSGRLALQCSRWRAIGGQETSSFRNP